MTGVRAALRPRRALGPALLVLGLWWAAPVLREGVPGCRVATACPSQVGLHLGLVVGLGLPATYLAASGATGLLEAALPPESRPSGLFAPPTGAWHALLVTAGAGAITLLLAGYGAVWTAGGAWLVYGLHVPVVAVGGLLEGVLAGTVPGWWAGLAGGAGWLLAAVGQAGWWYGIAHALAGVRARVN